jgi:hypothetical protein
MKEGRKEGRKQGARNNLLSAWRQSLLTD